MNEFNAITLTIWFWCYLGVCILFVIIELILETWLRKAAPSVKIRNQYNLREKFWIFQWPFGQKWTSLLKHEPSQFLEFRRRLKISRVFFVVFVTIFILVGRFDFPIFSGPLSGLSEIKEESVRKQQEYEEKFCQKVRKLRKHREDLRYLDERCRR